MSLSVEVTHVRSDSAVSFDLDLGEEGEGVSQQQRQDTSAAFFGYLKEKALNDTELSADQLTALQFRQCDVEERGDGECMNDGGVWLTVGGGKADSGWREELTVGGGKAMSR